MLAPRVRCQVLAAQPHSVLWGLHTFPCRGAEETPEQDLGVAARSRGGLWGRHAVLIWSLGWTHSACLLGTAVCTRPRG